LRGCEAIGALVIVASVGLIKPDELALIARVRRRDFILSLSRLPGSWRSGYSTA
jgi:hypothetical protein